MWSNIKCKKQQFRHKGLFMWNCVAVVISGRMVMTDSWPSWVTAPLPLSLCVAGNTCSTYKQRTFTDYIQAANQTAASVWHTGYVGWLTHGEPANTPVYSKKTLKDRLLFLSAMKSCKTSKSTSENSCCLSCFHLTQQSVRHLELFKVKFLSWNDKFSRRELQNKLAKVSSRFVSVLLSNEFTSCLDQ